MACRLLVCRLIIGTITYNNIKSKLSQNQYAFVHENIHLWYRHLRRGRRKVSTITYWIVLKKCKYMNGLAQDYGNCIANALEVLQSCTKPSICLHFTPNLHTATAQAGELLTRGMQGPTKFTPPIPWPLMIWSRISIFLILTRFPRINPGPSP